MLEASNLIVVDGVATLTLSTANGLNLLTENLISRLEDHLAILENDRRVRCLILTGTKDIFSAGADLRCLADLSHEAARRFVERGQNLCSRLEALSFPTIASLNGHAIGGGCELALACTFRFASEAATMGLPEVKLGIMPGFGGTQRLPRLIGVQPALRLILGGSRISAHEAHHLGLVDEVLTREELTTRVFQYAAGIASGSEIAISNALSAVNASRTSTLEGGLRREAELFEKVFRSPDRVAGIVAFLEKRSPSFAAVR